jgi:hypothetical protein
MSGQTITEAMSELCRCGHDRRQHLDDEWCSGCDCQWFGPSLSKHESDDATPAAAQAGQVAPSMDEHQQMIEVHVEWRTNDAGLERESETERPICRYCWHEGPDGQPRHQSWPCEVVRLRADLQQAREGEANLRAMLEEVIAANRTAISGHALARLQQALATSTSPTISVALTDRQADESSQP